MFDKKNLIHRVKLLSEELNGKQIERESEISLLIITFFARKNLFFLGEPGVSKTGLLKIFSTILEDGKVFDWTIKNDTKYEELFGDRYEDDSGKMIYDTSDSIVDSHITILDEVWKGNSKILNSLLSAMSDYRVVEIRGRGVIKIPNLSTLGASNELPSDVSLKALKDRFTVMMKVVPIKDDDNWIKFISRDYDRVPILQNKFKLVELEYIYRESLKIKISSSLYQVMLKIKNKIKSLKISCSDRRFDGTVEILKVSAFLNNRKEVDITDIFLMIHMVWEIETDIKKIKDLIFEIIFGNMDEVKKSIIKNNEDFLKQQSIKNGVLNDFLKFRFTFEHSSNAEFNFNINSVINLINNFKTILIGYQSIGNHFKESTYLEQLIYKHLFLPNFTNKIYKIIDINKIYEESLQLEKEIKLLDSWILENQQLYKYNSKVNKL